jgi:hypothetical protein
MPGLAAGASTGSVLVMAAAAGAATTAGSAAGWEVVTGGGVTQPAATATMRKIEIISLFMVMFSLGKMDVSRFSPEIHANSFSRSQAFPDAVRTWACELLKTFDRVHTSYHRTVENLWRIGRPKVGGTPLRSG